MSNNINNYLNYIQEFIQKPEIKKSKKEVYLFHGTRMSIDLIKKRGLTLKHNGSHHASIKGTAIWFTSSQKYSILYTKEKILTKERKGKVLLCKLNVKYLEFVERPFYLFDEYVYRNDIPYNNIIIEGEKRFNEIISKVKYLKGIK